MNTKRYKRFQRLVSVNIEGISSDEEDLELWRILRSHTGLNDEFLQIRNIHYLMKVLCDPTASETAFVNRVKNALNPDRLSDQDFISAVQNKLLEAKPHKRSLIQLPAFRIAASIIIAIGCAALYFNLFSNGQNPVPHLSVSENRYLAWTYEPQISKIKYNIASLYPSMNTSPPLYRKPDNPIFINIKQMNQKMIRSERLWPLSSSINTR